MPPIRVAAVMEAHTLTGPAKNLIQFAARARVPDGVRPTASVSIITFVRGRSASENHTNAFIEAARDLEIPVHVVPERYRFDRDVVNRLISAIDRTEADIVQTHGIKGHYFLSLRKVHRNMPWIAFHHGYTTENTKVRLYNQLNRWTLPAADRVITVCRPFARALVKSGVAPRRLQVLPNSIDATPNASVAEVVALEGKLGIASSEQVVLAVGRFSSEKGHAELLQAMRMLREQEPGLPFKLVLVGDGVDRQKLDRLVDVLGLRDRVVFAGHQGNVRPFYARANLFVLPSHSEGSPNVLLEAMEAGVPIVATAVGGVPDTVENLRSALLVPPRDPAALAAAINELLSKPELAATLSKTARSIVEKHFRPGHYCQALLDVYSGVLAEARLGLTS